MTPAQRREAVYAYETAKLEADFYPKLARAEDALLRARTDPTWNRAAQTLVQGADYEWRRIGINEGLPRDVRTEVRRRIAALRTALEQLKMATRSNPKLSAGHRNAWLAECRHMGVIDSRMDRRSQHQVAARAWASLSEREQAAFLARGQRRNPRARGSKRQNPASAQPVSVPEVKQAIGDLTRYFSVWRSHAGVQVSYTKDTAWGGPNATVNLWNALVAAGLKHGPWRRPDVHSQPSALVEHL